MNRTKCPACTAEPRRAHTDAELKHFHAGAFILLGADGFDIPIDPGEYYFNTKARARRMCLDSLSSESRQVYQCLELHTMGFQREMAVTMEGGAVRPLSPKDIGIECKLSKQHVRRSLAELEAAGLAQRKGDGEGRLTKGHVVIHSWALPRIAQPINGSQRVATIPAWFHRDLQALEPLVKRLRLRLPDMEVAARESFLVTITASARRYQEEEKVVIALLRQVCAHAESGAHKRKNERTSERTGDASSSVSPPTPATTTTEPEPRPFRINLELSAIALVAEALNSDEEAAKTLISRCRERVADVTPQEIAEHVGMKRAQLAGRKNVHNLVGLLLDKKYGVPKMITPAAIAQYRARERAEAWREAAGNQRAEERAHEFANDDQPPAVSDEEARRKLKAMRGET